MNKNLDIIFVTFCGLITVLMLMSVLKDKIDTTRRINNKMLESGIIGKRRGDLNGKIK